MTKAREDIPSDSDIEFLKKVASEMNSVMGLEPEIDLEDEGKLEAVIRNESKEIDLKEDEGKFSEGVEDYFKVEELWPVTKVEAKTETKPETKKEETVSKEKGKAKSKAKKKKVASKKKSASKKNVVTVKPKVKKDEKKTNLKTAYTRSHALVDALKKGGTRKNIIELSNQLYVKKGGMDKINIATNCFSLSIPVLVILGGIEKKNSKYALIK